MIPIRPAGLSRNASRARKTSRRASPRGARRSWLARLRRWIVVTVAIVLLAPAGLLLLHRFVPVPLTPLMVIRLAEGEGLEKDWVPLERIAPALPRAVIAAEDNLFCEHRGFDWQALWGEMRVFVGGRRPRGASTITMQTAKNLFLWPQRSFARKVLEAWITPQIELLWDKRRIMEVYLNVVEFGPGIYGAEAAAQAHFGKPASALSPTETALLAAVLPNPRAWSPRRPTDHLRGRVRTIRTRVGQLGPMLDCVGPA